MHDRLINLRKGWLLRAWIAFQVCLLVLCYGGSSVPVETDPYPGIKAIIFDCDGVLVDTEHLKFLAWQEAFSSKNVPFSLEDYMPLVGHSAETILQMVEKNKGIKLSEEIIQLRNQKYQKLQAKGVPPLQEMVEFAYRLSQQREELGVKLALASSASQEEILVNLKQMGLDQAFDLVISGSDDLDGYIDAEGKNKPKPYIYLEAAKRLQVLPKDCLVFEDTTAGIDAAADAGMNVVAVPNRFTIGQNFSKASRILSSHQELADLKLLRIKDESPIDHFKVIHKPATMIIGIECRTSNDPQAGPKDISQLWHKFSAENVISKIPSKTSDEVIALYCDYAGDHTQPYSCVIGCVVDSLEKIPAGMVGKVIPAATFAVYHAKGDFPKSVVNTWNTVWSSNLKRTYIGDYEVYGSKFASSKEVDILVAIEGD